MRASKWSNIHTENIDTVRARVTEKEREREKKWQQVFVYEWTNRAFKFIVRAIEILSCCTTVRCRRRRRRCLFLLICVYFFLFASLSSRSLYLPSTLCRASSNLSFSISLDFLRMFIDDLCMCSHNDHRAFKWQFLSINGKYDYNCIQMKKKNVFQNRQKPNMIQPIWIQILSLSSSRNPIEIVIVWMWS